MRNAVAPSAMAPHARERSATPSAPGAPHDRRSVPLTVVALVTAAVACAHGQDRDPRPRPRSADPGPAHSIPATQQRPWTFAAISDLHIPRDGHIPPALERAVAAVIASHPRFVVVTGDFTDGEPFDPRWRILEAPRWWQSARRALSPIRGAGIPVLPIAGNHDSYLSIYRADYAAAWQDLDAWAAPLRITGNGQPHSGLALDAAPFSYGVDVDDVHLTLAHVVDESLDPSVASWIGRDLAAASGARLRIVFGHVPLASVAATPRPSFIAGFGQILANGRADLYVAGHEHLVWDDDVELPTGARLHQVIVGTACASWRFGPSPAARERARCVYTPQVACCTMPHERIAFELQRERGGWFEAHALTYTLFEVDGIRITAHAIAVGDSGATEPFSRPSPCGANIR